MPSVGFANPEKSPPSAMFGSLSLRHPVFFVAFFG
jgi:hypothetical protein